MTHKPLRNALRNTILALTLFGLGLGITTAKAAKADSLENMERERAILVDTILSGDLSAGERQQRLELSRARLIDMERMVLRDDSLAGKDTAHVRAAFANYDLTFLVHEAAEKRRALGDHWLDGVGLSTQTVTNARMGRR